MSEEHIYKSNPSSTSGTIISCSCGKGFNTIAEAQQHQQWQLQLAIADRQVVTQRVDVNPKSHTYINDSQPPKTGGK